MPQTEQQTEGPSPFAAPQVSLPKGGGAIRGLGEKFQTNPVNGTATLSIPIPLSKTRGEFQPALALSYSSGSGNGPYGLGWTLGLPSVSRRTDKGVPRYMPCRFREGKSNRNNMWVSPTTFSLGRGPSRG